MNTDIAADALQDYLRVVGPLSYPERYVEDVVDLFLIGVWDALGSENLTEVDVYAAAWAAIVYVETTTWPSRLLHLEAVAIEAIDIALSLTARLLAH